MFSSFLQPLHQHSCNDNKMLWAAICLAFFGFLRISEFTFDKVFDPDIHLAATDIIFRPSFSNQEFSQVRLKSSKTDPFRQGILLTIGATKNHLCPVQAMKNYAPHCPTTGFLFAYKSGKLLDRNSFTKEIRQLLEMGCYQSREYAGHSFRIGAATTAAKANLPPWLIKALGRWASDCHIRTPEKTLIEASTKLLL